MKRTPVVTSVIIVLFYCQLLIAGCKSNETSLPGTINPTSPSESIPTEENEISSESETSGDREISPCDLTSELIDQIVDVTGQIVFVDHGDPEGKYAELEASGCTVGVWMSLEKWDQWNAQEKELLQPGVQVTVRGFLVTFEDRFIVDVIGPPQSYVSSDGAPGAVEGQNANAQVSNDEEWWLKPQTYHNGEGPDIDNISQMNITVLHDWSSLFWGQENNPDEYWSYKSIQQRWDEAHRQGMRVEAVISILDIWFIEFGPQDEIYPFSGIDLDGEHIQYEDPPGFVGCTNQHGWQIYLENKMKEAVDLGVDGFIIDDYEGTSRWVSGTPVGMAGLEAGPGGCFCTECEAGFREYLRDKYSGEELLSFEISDIDSFDYSEYLLERGWTKERLGDESLKFAGWESNPEISVPLYEDYFIFQNQKILDFTQELKESIKTYAREKYGKEIAWSINLSEQTYGTHKYLSSYDRNVGAIWYFGFPPKGTESHYYRLDFGIFHAPRIREVSRDPLVVAVINEYGTDNLLAIKDAEAYANQASWIEMGYFTEEGPSEEEIEASFHTDPERKYKYNSFYLENEEVFDFEGIASMAKVAVLYASPSINNNLYNHTIAFNGICEILTDLHVQYDPIFTGDGISTDDSLSQDVLNDYEMVFLPNTASLTDSQVEVILEFSKAGGTIVALGDVGITDESGMQVERPELKALTGQFHSELGSGEFYHLRVNFFQAEGIMDEDIHDIASAYFKYYIENNDPAVTPFLDIYEEEPIEHIPDAAADAIRGEIAEVIANAISSRIILDTFSESIGIQAYLKPGPPQMIFVHLINYDYELQTDTINDQTNIPIAILNPNGFDAESVRVISPDFDQSEEIDFIIDDDYIKFTIPSLHIWDVIVIE
jgi:hypothetical protein